MIKRLANFFRGLCLVVGITALPTDATPEEERNFVLMWMGIIVLIIGTFAALFYLFL